MASDTGSRIAHHNKARRATHFNSHVSPSRLLSSCWAMPTGGLHHRQVLCRPPALKAFCCRARHRWLTPPAGRVSASGLKASARSWRPVVYTTGSSCVGLRPEGHLVRTFGPREPAGRNIHCRWCEPPVPGSPTTTKPGGRHTSTPMCRPPGCSLLAGRCLPVVYTTGNSCVGLRPEDICAVLDPGGSHHRQVLCRPPALGRRRGSWLWRFGGSFG
ncbi:hypothetical protein EC9_06300 [Rosistilla ulvae]|uniref:Uncharacterized protein n=1 Tax=Rosistilla ulvae TaxID=1930277 RepID=A0A517LV22_9BACT|nr:hypothetical protein EC9_06300 [Rosistilla ulvae]